MFDNWDIFIENGPKVVTVAPIKIESSMVESQYEDARSAAFFAMGMSIKRKEPVLLFIPGVYLANIYTAITEAWFQKAEVIVYAFFNKISDVNTSWADRCAKTLTIHVDEYSEKHEEILSYHHMHSPVLINIVGVEIGDEKVEYSDITDCISRVDNSAEFLCYNDKIQNKNNIKEEYKYGILSKYIGMSVVKNVGYLICDSACMLVDINIFRTRYANENIKIVVLDNGKLKENEIDQWIKSNGWKCKRVKKMDDEAAEWIKIQKEQAVLIVGQGAFL